MAAEPACRQAEEGGLEEEKEGDEQDAQGQDYESYVICVNLK